MFDKKPIYIGKNTRKQLTPWSLRKALKAFTQSSFTGVIRPPCVKHEEGPLAATVIGVSRTPEAEQSPASAYGCSILQAFETKSMALQTVCGLD